MAALRAGDQPRVRALILAGLAERWGGDTDPAANPDLDDLATAYPGGTTLVAWLADTPVGTGTVVPRRPGVEEIVRMSVAPAVRGRGVARRLLGLLVAAAGARGATRVVCETCAHWDSAVRLYLGYGFTLVGYTDHGHYRDAHFALELYR